MSDTADADDHRARGRAGRAGERDRAAARRVHPRPVAAAEQLGPLGRGVRGGRLHGADAGLAGRSRDRRGGQRPPRGVRRQDRRPGRRPLRRDHPQARPQAGRHRPLLRRAAHADPRRARARGRVGGDRPGAVPRRAAAADLGAEGRPARCSATRPTATARSRSPTSSSATRFANAVGEDEAKELYETFAVPAPGAPLFQAAAANLNPWTEAKVDTREPRPRPAADHLRREGPHRPVGDRRTPPSSGRSATRA